MHESQKHYLNEKKALHIKVHAEQFYVCEDLEQAKLLMKKIRRVVASKRWR